MIYLLVFNPMATGAAKVVMGHFSLVLGKAVSVMIHSGLHASDAYFHHGLFSSLVYNSSVFVPYEMAHDMKRLDMTSVSRSYITLFFMAIEILSFYLMSGHLPWTLQYVE